ncbi:gliding motility-associated C-terminal domain-containing protein [Lacinutrix neustonica]|uniref:Gliding motility-associated C-terminal domain-containing protein n=1 Tax=Lacinutrix neustonica TaxID=2980107 RepID=A0A9E8MXJ5_9FLAO|nr:gliding motility-associated C-terminal domain-containing protein [Lacinutrix neustonica]WAC02851.1 gliding motility-associated C-terminal domain-containing protein [Lacinutrix neustonica]
MDSFAIEFEANYNGEINPIVQTSNSSNSTNACGVGNNLPTIITINDPSPANWITNPGALDVTLECANASELEDAQALAPIASCSGLTPIKTAGPFVPNNSSCSTNGSYTNTWTFTDACGNSIANYVQIITLNDTTGPDLSNCTVTSETLECAGTDNEAVADAWNANNITALQTCGTDACDADATNTVTSDYDFNNLSSTCGLGGTITVIYTVADDCGNTTNLTATLTLEDTIGPDLSNCTVTSETLECAGTDNEAVADAWNANNITAPETCGTDACDADATNTVTSDYDFNNLSTTCGLGGTITVIYTVADDCGNTTNLTATLTLEDTIGPDLSNCTVTSETLECAGTDNEAVADAWNANNITAPETCGTDACDADATNTVTSDYDFNNLSTTCGLGGTITVIYTVADDCGNTTNLTATLTLEDTIGPDLSNCTVTSETLECAGTDNEAVADAWNANNITALQTCGTDACDADATNTVTSDYDFNNLSTTCGLGGTITVIYTVADDCGNTTNLTATLTLEDTIGPDLSNCTVTSETLECAGTDNEAVADAWNANNITAPETCGTDACDADATNTVTSDYDFNNLSTTCGLGGTITVIYTVADDCGNTTNLTATLTLEDTIGPDLSNCTVTSETLECAGTDNESVADAWNANNITAPETCGTDACDADATNTVTSDYDFNNLSTTCGLGGTITVIYTVADDCGNTTNLTATLTLEDTIGPDLSNCTVTSETLECAGTDNEAVADAWNANNITAPETCGTDACDADATNTVTSDYDFNNLSSTCGLGGTITVIYTVADDCGNTTNLTATLTLEDTIGPDLSNCTVTSETLECAGTDNEAVADAWNANNITAPETCGTDACDADATNTVTSDYDFNNLSTTCGLGGTITVIYTVADDCGNTTNLTATLTLEDTIGPDLSNCTVTSETLECAGTDNEAVADAWNANNITALQTCGTDACDADATNTVTSDYDFNNLSTTCGLGGTITVIYTVADDCGNTTNLTATLTLEDTIGPDLSNCTVTSEALECAGTDNEAVADAWNANNITAPETCGTDACDADATNTVTSDYDFNNLSTTCGLGGTITVIYTVADDCGNTTNLTATLTLEDTIGPDLSNCTVTSETLECAGTDNEAVADAWNANNITALQTCGTDACDADATNTVTSDYDFNNLSTTCGLGGTITVIYTVADDCGNTTNLTATLTLEDTIGPDLSNCTVTSETLECAGTDNEAVADAWNANNITALQTCGTDACDADATNTVTSDYDFNNLSTTCGLGGTITVIYTVADDCGNTTNLTATLTLEDTIGPDLSNCTVTSETLECAGTDNEAVADAWNANNITALQTCGTDACDADATNTVTSDYDFNNLSTTCGLGGTITVIYTVADDCGNTTNLTATLTLEDTIGPDLSNCTVTSETLECAGTDNEAVADAWNANNITAPETCGTDACDADATNTVTSDYDFNNLSTTCGLGGTITVIYTVADDCGNTTNLTATLTLEDTTGPTLVTNIETESSVACSDIPEPPTLEFADACSDSAITVSLEETNTNTGDGQDYQIIWEWTATDSCNNSNVFTQILNVITENVITDFADERCTDDGIIDLFQYLPANADTSIAWTVEQGTVTLNTNGTFDPLELEVGIYIFSYTIPSEYCSETIRVTIDINADCIVLPCGSESFKVSKAVTPNGDGFNDLFAVQGLAKCGFIIDLTIFNRYGGIIFESKNYQNDWDGSSIKSSVGPANKLPNGTYYYVIILRDSGLDPITGPLYLGTK